MGSAEGLRSYAEKPNGNKIIRTKFDVCVCERQRVMSVLSCGSESEFCMEKCFDATPIVVFMS